MKQLCSAVFYLRAVYGLIHLDIKPDNLMINDKNQLALIDLGHTEKIGAKIDHLTGTDVYRPEEVEEKDPYEVAPADIYSLVMTNLVIMTQNIPFGKDYREILKTVYGTSGHKDFFFGSLLGSQAVSGQYPVDFQDLLYRCLNPNPSKRPSIYEFSQCSWIADAPDTLDDRLANELKYVMGLQLHSKDV